MPHSERPRQHDCGIRERSPTSTLQKALADRSGAATSKGRASVHQSRLSELSGRKKKREMMVMMKLSTIFIIPVTVRCSQEATVHCPAINICILVRSSDGSEGRIEERSQWQRVEPSGPLESRVGATQ